MARRLHDRGHGGRMYWRCPTRTLPRSNLGRCHCSRIVPSPPREIISMACAALRCLKYDWRTSLFLTTLAFWLRSSVVSVLYSITTITRAPPATLVFLFLPPLSIELCLQLDSAMTPPLHYRLMSSRDLFSLLLLFTYDGHH